MINKLKLLAASSSSVALAMLCAAPAFAAGTTQGTGITNTVNVNFQVGGVAQTQQTAANTFVVDREIIFTVAEAATTGTTLVTPGQSAQVTRFQVTNISNDMLDFSLMAMHQSTSTSTAHGGSDGFDLTGLAFFVDVNGDGIYQSNTDTATTIDNLAADASRYVFIVGNVPLTATNGQIAGVQLIGTALNSNGTTITAATDSTANGAGTVETIFADAAKSGVGGNSAARDGTDVATDDYTVQAAVLSLFKSSRVVSDGVSGSNFKSVPGAVVEYCISVANATGGATATNISVSDLVPANTTYVPGSIFVDSTVTSPGAGQSCSGGTGVTDASDADAGSFGTPANTVTGTLSNIAATQSRALIFRATIN